MKSLERIGAMGERQIAEMKEVNDDGEKFCKSRKECDEILKRDEDIPDELCVLCALDWLKMEENT